MWWLYILFFLLGGICGIILMSLMIAAKNGDSL